MLNQPALHAHSLLRAERLTLAVLLCGVASLALSDFVSPIYWSLSVLAALLRLWRGPAFHLTEMQASFIGWAGFFWVGLELVLGRELVIAFTDFLLILALAVVVEAPAPRNHLHRMLVGLFLLLGAAVLTDSALFVIPLTAMLWFLWRAAACLYGLNWPGGDLPATSVNQDLRWMPVMVGVVALLFISLPRFEFHSLLNAQQPRMQTTGFADQVQLGDFARQLDEQVVMRVESTEPDENQQAFRQRIAGRYWRGVALSSFTGKGWQRAPDQYVQQISARSDIHFLKHAGLGVAVYREASDHPYVHLPDGAALIRGLPESARMDAAGALSFNTAPSRRLRLAMQLASPALHSEKYMHPPVPRERDTSAVPVALTRWMQGVTESATDKHQALVALRNELKGWDYDLNVPVDAAHPIASFLQNRRGHCELFATSLALAARQLGFASRIVNGYYAGDWNDVGGFLLIRNKHAHSWVEIWLDHQWQRMDPTPPSRWLTTDTPFMAFDEVWESAKMAWYRYVLAFEDSDRSHLIQAIWQIVKIYSLWLLVLIGAVFSIWWGWRRYFTRFIAMVGRRRSNKCWPLLDQWLQGWGIYRQQYQPLRAINHPDGINKKRWAAFVYAWESQAYGDVQAWCRGDLKRHLRALLKGC
jgi:hypothetical protein